MNKLEQYISDHKAHFEEEPPTGHFNRMQQKINHNFRWTVALNWSISIAASIAILFSAGIIWQHIKKPDNNRIMCENTIDMKGCYLNKMNAVASRIEALTKNLDSWDRQQVMTDVQNIIDVTGSGFENEIPKELPANEAKSILSDYYRHNLENLESIANRLNEL